MITYAYDGLQRLTAAAESPGTSYAYGYDLAGNRTGVWLNGTRTLTQTFNAANQVDGFTYDAAGNLINDGATTYGYDALGRMTTRGSTTYSYNGDGTLVYDGTTRYTQDLASPLSQVLQTTQGSATTKYLYGQDRLAAQTSTAKTWYIGDALGSVRLTLNDAGAPLGAVNYDPWGTPESGTVPPFGFTGELQNATTGLVNLRARWYSTGQGRFVSRDSFEGLMARPQTLAQYPYAENDPANRVDRSGRIAVFIAGAGNNNTPWDDPGVGVWQMANRFVKTGKIKGPVLVTSSAWDTVGTVSNIIESHMRTNEICLNEPIILIGHSLGARQVMEIADRLGGVGMYVSPPIQIDLVVTLDLIKIDVTGNDQPISVSKSSNVMRQLNFYSDQPIMGYAGKIPVIDKEVLKLQIIRNITGAENIHIAGSEHVTIDNEYLDEGNTKRNIAWSWIESAIAKVMSNY